MNLNMNTNIKIGYCGFNNIGNTCYMNSILQLLSHSKHIVSFLIKNRNSNISQYENYLYQGAIQRTGDVERKRLNLKEDDQVSIKKTDIDEFMNLALINRLADIINTIIYKGSSKITPSSFKQIIDLKLPSFRGFSQHDSHELLLQILDIMIEETGIEAEQIINNVPECIKNYIGYLQQVKQNLKKTSIIDEKKLIIAELNEYKKAHIDTINKYNGLNYMIKVFKLRYNPLIDKMKTFLINTVTCSNCNNQTCNYEDTTILTLQIKNNLTECFENLIKTENIENYHCAVCNEKHIVYKNTKIFRPGMILFVHLKRFKQLPNGRTVKDNTNINFPHEINLDKYCDNYMKTDQSLPYTYKFKGLSNHHGGINGGHYTADCVSIVDNKTWYHFNDGSVGEYTGSNINTESGYIGMYEMENL